MAAAVGLAAVGCGDDRPKIVKPDNPTPPPDESMRLRIGPRNVPPPQAPE